MDDQRSRSEIGGLVRLLLGRDVVTASWSNSTGIKWETMILEGMLKGFIETN